MSPTPPPVFELRNVHKRFTKKQDLIGRVLELAGKAPTPRTVHAVNGVSLSIAQGGVVQGLKANVCGHGQGAFFKKPTGSGGRQTSGRAQWPAAWALPRGSAAWRAGSGGGRCSPKGA